MFMSAVLTSSALSNSVVIQSFPADTMATQVASVSSTMDVQSVSSSLPFPNDPSISVTPNDILSSTAASTTAHQQQRNLIIILTTTLSTLALMALGFLIYMYILYRRGRRLNIPFWQTRNITPIDDDEIATWRKMHDHHPSMEKLTFIEPGSPTTLSAPRLRGSDVKQPLQIIPPNAQVLSIQREPNTSPQSPHCSASVYSSHWTAPTSPAQAYLVAQAPNARVGLTDDIIPGEEPFIASTAPRSRRPSFKISSSSLGHQREKSSRSIVSSKSVWSLRSTNSYGEIDGDDAPPLRKSSWHYHQHGVDDDACVECDIPLPSPLPTASTANLLPRR